MRYLFLVLFIFLASCATPQNEPQSYYGKVYAPGKVSIDGSGVFVSTAGVKAAEHRSIARRAAYSRLMNSAISAGYKSVKIYREEISGSFGYKIAIRGRLFLHVGDNDGIYPIGNISRVLKGLPLKEIKKKPVAKAKYVKKVRSAKRTAPKKAVKQNIAVEKIDVQPEPTLSPAPDVILPEADVQPIVETEDVPDGAPTIIMAPEDITGSIKKPLNGDTAMNSSLKIKQAIPNPTDAITIPKALSGTPLGVIVPKK